MSEPHRRETLPRSVRLRSRKAFGRVFGQRLRASDRRLTLYVAPSEQAITRLGIAVSHRLGTAVRRNRIKRLVREAFRRLRHQLPAGTDWVVVPKPGPEPTVPDLERSLGELAARLRAGVREVPGASEADNNSGQIRKLRKKKAPGAL